MNPSKQEIEDSWKTQITHAAFLNVVQKVMGMTNEQRQKWLEENTDEYETDFGIFIIYR